MSVLRYQISNKDGVVEGFSGLQIQMHGFSMYDLPSQHPSFTAMGRHHGERDPNDRRMLCKLWEGMEKPWSELRCGRWEARQRHPTRSLQIPTFFLNVRVIDADRGDMLSGRRKISNEVHKEPTACSGACHQLHQVAQDPEASSHRTV
jgi:hypothetical protein